MTWPCVIGELFTLQLVSEGRSIARFGDGEFNLCLGGLCITQTYTDHLAKRLRKILANPQGDCLVGIPRQAGPKKEFWSKYDRQKVRDLFSADHHYASALITRPDSAPWIDTPEYWDKVKDLWRDKDVTLVRGSTKSLTSDIMVEARSVREIIVPHKNAFMRYGELLEKVGRPSVAILCLGPTATVMAYDLSKLGVHAMDLGHIGMFLRKHEQHIPMTVTQEDREFDQS